MPDILPAIAHEQFWALSPHTATEILRSLREKITASTAQGAASAAMLAAPNFKSSKPYAVQRGVAIIQVSGTIIRTSWWGGYSAAQDTIRNTLDAALADTSVKAILFSFNSPGGIVSGTKELADHIAQAKTHKPCAAYADGLCASAAFWLASATGRIYAPQTAQVGSVGVLAVHADWSKFNEKMGVAYTYITGGAFKAAGNEDNPLSDSDKARLQQQITALHDIFTADVTKNLGITTARSAWAEGQTFLATEAQSLGLIQHIVADLPAAIQQLAEDKMTKAELAQQFPELLAEIQAETLAQAKTELAAQAAANSPQNAEVTRTETLALVTAVLGEEASAKVQAVASAGISAQQFTALAPLLQAASPQISPKAPTAENTLSSQILAGITTAHGQPVSGVANANAALPNPKPLVANAAKRCK